MFDLISRVLLKGVGLGVMTKEKVEALGAEMSRRADLTEKQGEAFMADLLVESEKAARDLDGKVAAAARSALDKMDIATKHDVAALDERITRIEQRMTADGSSEKSEWLGSTA